MSTMDIFTVYMYIFFFTNIVAYISIKKSKSPISHACCANQKVGLGKEGARLLVHRVIWSGSIRCSSYLEDLAGPVPADSRR